MNEHESYDNKELNSMEEYSMDELLELVGKLAEKYTGKTSTSVSYEAAQQLMEAILYCIGEYRNSEGAGEKVQLQTMESGPLQEAYALGYQMVLDKVYAARDLYHSLIKDFNDYKCQNYRDTIRNGIPAFFVHYDARFSPQDHKLTLDYPTLQSVSHLCGVDAIHQYLKNIQAENRFLKFFPAQQIEELLVSIQPEYKKLYFDNICQAVLERALLCMIADQPVKELKLEETDIPVIREFLDYSEEGMEPQNQNTKQAAIRLSNLAKLMLKNIAPRSRELPDYFSAMLLYEDIAVRLQWRLSGKTSV